MQNTLTNIANYLPYRNSCIHPIYPTPMHLFSSILSDQQHLNLPVYIVPTLDVADPNGSVYYRCMLILLQKSYVGIKYCKGI